MPFVEVDSDFYTGPTRWQGVGVAPEMASLARRLGPVDCVVGARVNILGTNYKIISADVATHSFMEDFPQYFPCSHGDNLMRRLQAQMASISAQEMMAAAQGLDPAGTGVIPPQLFTQFLNFFNFDLSEQVRILIVMQYNKKLIVVYCRNNKHLLESFLAENQVACNSENSSQSCGRPDHRKLHACMLNGEGSCGYRSRSKTASSITICAEAAIFLLHLSHSGRRLRQSVLSVLLRFEIIYCSQFRLQFHLHY